MSDFENDLIQKVDIDNVEIVDDLCTIEDLAMEVKNLRKRIAFYKEFKKRKSEVISGAIGKLEKKVSQINKIILDSLKAHGEKSINFPGTCQIKTVSPRKTWEVKDAEKLTNFLQEKNLFDEVLSKVEYKFDKKKLNAMFNQMESRGEITKEERKIFDMVDSESYISITYEEVDNEEKEDTNVSGDNINYDTL